MSLLFGAKSRKRSTNCRYKAKRSTKTCMNRKLKRTTKSHCRALVDAGACGGDPSCNWSNIRGCVARPHYRLTRTGRHKKIAYQGPMGMPAGFTNPVEPAAIAAAVAAGSVAPIVEPMAPVAAEAVVTESVAPVDALAAIENSLNSEFGRKADCRRRRNRSKAVCKRRTTKRRSTKRRATKRSKTVSHCRALVDAAACGGDPSCNWTARGCVGRRSYKTTKAGYHKAVAYHGPMGKPVGFTEFGKRRKVHRRKAHRKGRKVHRKTAKKPAKALLRKCRKMGIKVTIKRGGKRVYKKTSDLKKALKKHMKKMHRSHRR